MISEEKKEPLLEAATTYLSSPMLRAIGWIVFIDYVVYKPFEVTFFDQLKRQFPDATLFCQFQGDMAFWTAILLAVVSLCIAPLCFSRFSWFTMASIPPMAVLLMTLFFYGAVYYEYSFAYLIGAVQYCSGHAIKYAFFNTSKELAFIPLPTKEKVQGKVLIDGFLGRAGYGISSLGTLTFIRSVGTITAAVPFAAALHLVLMLFWLRANYRLSQPPPSALINCTVDR